ACGDDRELLQEVLSFLDLDDQADTFIGAPLWRVMPEDSDGERAERLGPYRLHHLLGQGGMGEVYLATREDDYRQKVAIKRTLAPVLRDDMEERFVNERQILATLQHPGIARLLDGGTDERGFPYLVMEYVDGVPIDTYFADQELNIRQRLRLMSKVCRIVHHAHQNLVVHRDLKPSNILVTPEGQPRLLDFGIAKLLRADAHATAQEMAVLTPSCASPEQIMGERVTTACDVYALGVLLYRLLSGKAPYELHGLPFPAVRRIVCLQDIEKPSHAALSARRTPTRDPDSVSIPRTELLPDTAPVAARGAEQRRIAKTLRGDLDSIILKAMRKEAAHRYGSAAELADDIDRYLAGLPVESRRGSWFYHAGRHLRRNKPIVALLALIVVLAVTSTILGLRAESSRRTAVEAEAGSTALKDFLIGILRSARPDAAKGTDRTVREVVEAARPTVASKLAGQPRLQAEMSSILAEVLIELGDSPQALELYQEALATTISLDEPPCTLQDGKIILADRIASVGNALYSLRQYGLAAPHFRKALTLRRACGDSPLSIALTLSNITNARFRQGETRGIGQDYRRVLDLRLEHSRDEQEIARAYQSLGAWSLDDQRHDEAIAHFEEALRRLRRVQEEPSSSIASNKHSLARAFHAAGRLDESRELYTSAVDDFAVLYGADDSRVTRLKAHVVRLLLDRGDLEEACAMARGALDAAEAIEPEDAGTVAIVGSVWGACLVRRGDAERGRELLAAGYRELSKDSRPQAFPTRWTRDALESARRIATDELEATSAPQAPGDALR
ncbi:MAG: serine/threonine-protein kinase, partial [Acidobacteriota bacterium]